MSIAEHGAPTPGEINVLLIARAFNGRYALQGSVNYAEAVVAARRLVEREYGELFVDDAGGETFRINSAGMKFLDARFAQAAAP